MHRLFRKMGQYEVAAEQSAIANAAEEISAVDDILPHAESLMETSTTYPLFCQNNSLDMINEIILQTPAAIRALLNSQTLFDLYQFAQYLSDDIRKKKLLNKKLNDKEAKKEMNLALSKRKALYKMVRKAFGQHLKADMVFFDAIKSDAKIYIKMQQQPLLKRFVNYFKDMVGKYPDRNMKIFQRYLKQQRQRMSVQEIKQDSRFAVSDELTKLAQAVNEHLNQAGWERMAEILNISKHNISSCTIRAADDKEFLIEFKRLHGAVHGVGSQVYSLNRQQVEAFIAERDIAIRGLHRP